MSNPEFRKIVTEAIRYWERARLLYNIALALVVIAVVAINWHVAVGHASLDKFLQLFMLSVLANIAYCAAYPVDLLAQASEFKLTWVKWRWVLWIIGTLFGSIWAYFIVRGSLGAT
jgi:hypothetical protein